MFFEIAKMKYPQQLPIDKTIPLYYRSLIILAGPSGSGKSTVARRYFSPSMWVSTDHCRYLICGHPLNQKVSDDAFELFYMIIEKRLKNGYPVIADSTALQRKYRSRLRDLAEKYDFHTALLLLDLPWEVCLKNDARRRYCVGEEVLRRQFSSLQKTKEQLTEEEYQHIVVCNSWSQLMNMSFRFTDPLVEKAESGPFAIIGDVHGCYGELVELLELLGYQKSSQGHYVHSRGRKAVFLGDLCDRGPYNIKTFELVYAMVTAGEALYIPGNHCDKLYRYLQGKSVKLLHGLDKTVAEIEELTPEAKQQFSERFIGMIEVAPPYLILADGQLVVAHAGILGKWIGQVRGRVKSFCLYGDVTGETDDKGFPVRRDWVTGYRGKTEIVYGHTPVKEAVWRNHTINIDLGVVFGGKLCALLYPERTTVDVGAHSLYDDSKTM